MASDMKREVEKYLGERFAVYSPEAIELAVDAVYAVANRKWTTRVWGKVKAAHVVKAWALQSFVIRARKGGGGARALIV